MRHLRIVTLLTGLFALVILNSCGGGSASTDINRGITAITPVVWVSAPATVNTGDSFTVYGWITLPAGTENDSITGSKGKLTFETWDSTTSSWTAVPGGSNIPLGPGAGDDAASASVSSAGYAVGDAIEVRVHFIPQGLKVGGQQLTSAFGYASVEVTQDVYDYQSDFVFENGVNVFSGYSAGTWCYSYYNGSGSGGNFTIGGSVGHGYTKQSIAGTVDGLDSGSAGGSGQTWTAYVPAGSTFEVCITISGASTHPNKQVFGGWTLKLEGTEVASLPTVSE